MSWRNPACSGYPDADDQEVTFLRGGGWVPPGQPFQPPAPTQPVGGLAPQGPPPQGVPNGQPFQPPAPTRPDGAWAPQGPPPQSLTPAQLNADVRCFITTLASGLHLGMPRINTFSSEAMPGKTEVSFEQWYHKVQCVKHHYPESVVQESIIRSLKGAVAHMARYRVLLPVAPTFYKKLMVILGTVASFDVLMQNFL